MIQSIMWMTLRSAAQSKSVRRQIFLTLVSITCLLILLARRYSGSLVLRSTLKPYSATQRDVFNTKVLTSATDRLKCSERPPGKVFPGAIYSDREKRLISCTLPKVGCTYWINIFRFLAPEGINYSSPFDIPRKVTHYSKMRKHYLDKGDYHTISSTSLRFMFVRNPYTRLWSAWIDKIWLPDFWRYNIKNLSHKGKKDEGIHACDVENVTFSRFLNIITSDQFLATPEKLGDHWVPYVYYCDACVFQPHFVGKMETFSADTRYILDYVNLTWVLDVPSTYTAGGGEGSDGHSKHFDHSLHEMKLLTEDMVGVVETSVKCLPAVKLFERLWIAYQYNGHIPAYASFPLQQLKKLNNTMTAFLELAKDAYLNWTNRKTEQHEQKKRAMVEAYRKVSNDVMERLQILYKFDFEMYNYEKRPEELYDYRTS